MSNERFAVHPGASKHYKSWNPEEGIFILPEGRKVMPGVALQGARGLRLPKLGPIVTQMPRRKRKPLLPIQVDVKRVLAWLVIVPGVLTLAALAVGCTGTVVERWL